MTVAGGVFLADSEYVWVGRFAPIGISQAHGSVGPSSILTTKCGLPSSHGDGVLHIECQAVCIILRFAISMRDSTL